MGHSFKKLFMFLLTLLALTFSAIGVTPVYAVTLTVTNTADSGAGSLRDTIAGAGVGDTIIFDTSLSGTTIYLASTLTLSKNVTIDGSALASRITISGDTDNNGTGNVRVFIVNGGVSATLNSLIITKGVATGISDGGGIDNSGMLTLTNSTLSGNSAYRGGGINNFGALTVTNSTLSGNSAEYGGGIANAGGTLTVTNSTLSGNSADYGGGILTDGGTQTVTNSTLSGNTATLGGGICNSFDATLTVTNSILSGNSATDGGGILNNGTLTITNSTFSGNSARTGGGIENFLSTLLTITNSTFSGNSADYGGGIFNDSATLIVTNSTFSGNSADYGGGIFNGGELTVTNSTLSSNSADYGGGIYNLDTLTIKNSTLSGNSATTVGGGIRNPSGGTLHYANTIIANSSAGGDCANAGTIGTNTNNLVEDNTCSASLFGDPTLGALASNGGASQTFALLAGSSAIDAGDNTTCTNSPVSGLDQRGVIRPYGAACDIGSYEFDPSAKDITAFSFTNPAATGVITGTDIAVTVPFGTNVTALVATFIATSTSVAVGSAPQVSGTTANDFTSPVTYTVTAADATTQDYIVMVTVAPAMVYKLFFPYVSQQ